MDNEKQLLIPTLYAPEILLAYLLIVAILVSASESAKYWLCSSSTGFLKFRKPLTGRIGWILLGLLFPLVLMFTFSRVNPSERTFLWIYWGPVSTFLCVTLVYLSGPKEVLLDLSARTCQVTKGWKFHSERQKYALTEKARIVLCWTSNQYYVFLQPDAEVKSRILLSVSVTKNGANFVAKEVAQELELPIVEGQRKKMLL